MAKEEKVGEVVGYYSKISVAAIQLTDGPLAAGDTVRIRGHTTDVTQPVDSMQIEHQAVQRAERGSEIAIKVRERVREKDTVYRVSE